MSRVPIRASARPTPGQSGAAGPKSNVRPANIRLAARLPSLTRPVTQVNGPRRWISVISIDSFAPSISQSSSPSRRCRLSWSLLSKRSYWKSLGGWEFADAGELAAQDAALHHAAFARGRVVA